MTGETAAELRARLNALRAGPDFDFEDALVDTWPAIDGMLTRLAASDENADRLAGMALRLAAEKGDLVARLAAAEAGHRTERRT